MHYDINPNFRFQIGISELSYPSKDSIDYSSIKFHPQNVTLEDLTFFIRKGYSYVNNFKSGIRKLQYFKGTNIISFDIDDSNVIMEDYVSGLYYQPSIYYTTFSNGIGHIDSYGNLKGDGINCFRLIYCFQRGVESISEYSNVYHHILEETGITDLEDECTKSCNQLLNGNGSDGLRILNTNLVYDIPSSIYNNNTLISTSVIYPTEKSNIETLKNSSEGKTFQINTTPTPPHIHLECTFKNDFFALSRKDFIEKYNNIVQHPIRTETPYLEVADDIRYTISPKKYFRVPRKFCFSKTSLGEKKRSIGKWKDGEKRHRKIYIAGIVYRIIYEDSLSSEQLLWLLTREIEFYYDNSDNKFNDKVMYGILCSVKNADLDEERLHEVEHSYRRMNKKYCQQVGITPQALSNFIRGEQTDDRIAELYDYGLTDCENIDFFRKMGLSISVSRLKRWRKKNNIRKRNIKTIV